MGFLQSSDLPVILQSENSDCGLACFAMIGSFLGYKTTVRELRQSFPVSQRGTSFKDLMQIGAHFGLSTRALKVDLAGLRHVRVPCVLHWDFSHFVVLASASHDSVVIHDPTRGRVELSLAEVSPHFTGAVLEVSPAASFARRDKTTRLRLKDVFQGFYGLGAPIRTALVTAVSLEFFVLLAPLFTQLVFDQVMAFQNFELLIQLGIAFSVLILVQNAIWLARAWSLNHLRSLAAVQLADRVFTHLLSLSVSFFERRSIGDILARFGSVAGILRTFTNGTLESLVDGLLSLVILVVLAIYSPLLALAAGVSMALYVAFRQLYYWPRWRAMQLQLAQAGKQYSLFLESLRAVRSIALFGRREERRAIWLNEFVEQLNAEHDAQRIDSYCKAATGIVIGLDRIVTVAIGVILVTGGSLSLGGFVAVLAFKEQFVSRFTSFVDKAFELRVLQLDCDRLSDIILESPEQATSENVPVRASRAPVSIELRNVRFRYSEFDPWTVNGVFLNVAPGESVAIIGRSGAGKSTLLKAIAGILRPQDGEILVDGQSIERFGVQNYRRALAAVFQDDPLFAGSIVENLSFFDADPDMEHVRSCAKLAQIDAEIDAMPMGYSTLIGDLGSVLSAGQKQRLLLARALYHRPSLLLLDEATSNLDAENESSVALCIDSLPLTRIVVAHRPQTIARMDKVYRMNDGGTLSLVPASSVLHAVTQ